MFDMIAYQSSYRIKNREKLAAYRASHREEARLRAKAWRKANPERRKEQWKKDAAKNRVRTIVRHAIRDGTLIKLPCEKCGASKLVHGHHPDYSKPLEVVWLCPHCHGLVHSISG